MPKRVDFFPHHAGLALISGTAALAKGEAERSEASVREPEANTKS